LLPLLPVAVVFVIVAAAPHTHTQVARELIQTFVTSLDRIHLIISDDTTATAPIELVPALDGVRANLLQQLAARAVRGDRALFPRAKSDLQAAFHALDSAATATSTCVLWRLRCCGS
jgi:hypothetical protein